MGVIAGIKMELVDVEGMESTKGREKERASVGGGALYLSIQRELSPQFEEMGIQFGSPDRRRVSPGDTKHPIVGEATGWYLNPPTVAPYFFPLIIPLQTTRVATSTCVYLFVHYRKQRKRDEKTENKKTRKLLSYLRTEKSFTEKSPSRAVERARMEEEAPAKNVLSSS